MSKTRALPTVWLIALSLMGLAPTVEAEPLTWTIETVATDGTLSWGFTAARGWAPDAAPFPVVMARDTDGSPAINFYSRESGVWVKTEVDNAARVGAVQHISGSTWGLVACDGTDCEAYKSTDNGATWPVVDVTFPSQASTQGAFTLDVQGTDWAFNRGFAGGSVYQSSTDDGVTWGAVQSCNGGAGGPIIQPRMDTTRPHPWALFLDTDGGGQDTALWESSDACGAAAESLVFEISGVESATSAASAGITDGGAAFFIDNVSPTSVYASFDPFSQAAVLLADDMLQAGSDYDVVGNGSRVVAAYKVAADTYKVTVADSNGAVVDYDLPALTGADLVRVQVSQGKIWVYFTTGGDLKVAFADQPDTPVGPTTPSGLSAVVAENDSPTAVEVQIRWPVSSNDPDQSQGDYQYDIYVGGVNVGSDATTSADGDGIRFNLVLLGSSSHQTYVFQVRAVNATSGLQSALSCAVSVDSSVLGDTDSCGDFAGPGGLVFTTPTDTAAGLKGFCADLMGDSSGSLFLCGLILAVITFLGLGGAFAAMAGAPGLPSVIAGALGAFGVMLFNVQAQIWSLGAAAILILLATGVALGLTRRLFLGRSSGGD